jgi:hypothetical protein
MAIVYYVTNYATKVEDPVWKRVAAAAEVLNAYGGTVTQRRVETEQSSAETSAENKTRQFLMRVANRVSAERALSQVEVVAHLLGYPTEFTHNGDWTVLNVSALYWHIFRRWPHLQFLAGRDTEELPDETVLFGKLDNQSPLYRHIRIVVNFSRHCHYMTTWRW